MKTESKSYPKIERSKREGMVFFPHDIHKVQKKNEERIKEDFYHYDLIKIPDKEQKIDDYEKFEEENDKELTKYAEGKWREKTGGGFVFAKIL